MGMERGGRCCTGPSCTCADLDAERQQSGGQRHPAGASPAGRMLGLQRTAGNRAVAGMITAMQRTGGQEQEDDPPLPAEEVEGTPHQTVVHGQTFSFQGQTNASYAHRFRAAGDRTTGSTHTGDLVSTFTVETNVSLPPVPAGLNECERPIVADAINNRLNAHEQEHVTAFRTYNGTTTTPYSITGTPPQVTAQLAQQHAAAERERRADSDAQSRALDPFNLEVDTSSCDPPEPEQAEPEQAPAEGGGASG